MLNRSTMQHRDFHIENMQTRETEEEYIIEGYFSVFGALYTIWDNNQETIAKGAFSDCLNDDVRALWNHNVDIVLGRTTNLTLQLREDDKGLYGTIKINKKDSDAVNAYERVKRGDVNQCSFGFDIIDEETEIRDDNSILWTIKKVKLYEVSPCVFPAYEETTVSARKRDFSDIQKRQNEAWQSQMLKKLKGEN